ncbi:MAG TPA: arginine deiminase family protein [Trebonia sp.]|nr:arginine deiminase family protein [Trebonia sp.]
MRLSHPQPFLQAAAEAMGLDELRVIETGLGPGRAGQWDDAGNLLAVSPGTVISYERHTLTNARLEAAGIEVVRYRAASLPAAAAARARCAAR